MLTPWQPHERAVLGPDILDVDPVAPHEQLEISVGERAQRRAWDGKGNHLGVPEQIP